MSECILHCHKIKQQGSKRKEHYVTCQECLYRDTPTCLVLREEFRKKNERKIL